MKVDNRERKEAGRDCAEETTRLISRALCGDREAFGELFVGHVSSVRRLLLSVIGPTPDLDDLVQDVFLAFHRSLPRFRGEARLGTWLHRITVNVAVSYLRRSRKNAVLRPPEDFAQRADPATADAHRQLLGKRMVAGLYGILKTLSPKRQVAFALITVQGLRIAEAAKLAGVSAPVMKSRVFFARREVRRRAGQDPYLGPLIEELERNVR